MRFFVPLLVLAGCATTAPLPPPPPGPPPSLVGTIGGEPFVGRMALMVTKNFQSSNNSWDRLMTLSHIRIYDRIVSCPSDVKDRGTFDTRQPPDRRTIHLLVEGMWPIPPSLLEFDLHADMAVAANRLLGADFQRGDTMQSAIGSIEILASSPDGGFIDLHLSSPGQQNPLFGAVSGKIPFVVCR